ncbi:hypothetical protein [Saccharibacillus kuerlensis]|uniref:Uncharacterized protein n=1 Tax=Saccharibacillus kuerlensis TaxID=459527 RepID=A0ABQ2L0F1_9BACL|nr:hypothetical protein [Saccharibacillus kuerlensis]GGN98498.1 hypothetical protein GCM10010969_17700 [Saccharibacillus kuerlensis]
MLTAPIIVLVLGCLLIILLANVILPRYFVTGEDQRALSDMPRLKGYMQGEIHQKGDKRPCPINFSYSFLYLPWSALCSVC